MGAGVGVGVRSKHHLVHLQVAVVERSLTIDRTRPVGGVDNEHAAVAQRFIVYVHVRRHEPGHECFVLQHRPIGRNGCTC